MKSNTNLVGQTFEVGMNIKERIQQEINMWTPLGHPALMQQFVLRNGQEFTPAPFKGKRMTPKACFQNAEAYCRSRPKLAFVEGYGWRTSLPILVHHAWCVNETGTVFDPTWGDPEDCQYFGVKFCRTTVEREWSRNRSASLLDTGRGLNIDLLFQIDPALRALLPARGGSQ